MSSYQYYRPSLFPPVVKNLIIINVLVFICQETFGQSNSSIDNLFALHDIHSVYFRPWQLITYMFMHGGFQHILGNMLAVWVFGSMLENYWGAKRFLQFYILTGMGAGLLHLGVLYIEMQPAWDYIKSFPAEEQAKYIYENNIVIMNQAINMTTVGASGAVFGCLVGAGYLFPNQIVNINLIFPIKIKWLVIIYGGIELVLAIQNSAGDTVAHFAHLGGAITAVIILFIWNKTKRKTLY